MVKNGLLKGNLNNDAFELSNDSETSCEEYLRSFLSSYVDTYLVVAHTIQKLIVGRASIDVDKLSKQLQTTIQKMYEEDVTMPINACLSETIQNAFARFEELGINTI